MTIHILAPDVAAKIAAGEVVERPANVAKELMENSLDAGATEIRVEVREGGMRLLRVIDNGHGMPADEAPLAFHRHATSKLTSADDLEHILTFGFRGEALYSIAAVSQVTLTTRHKSEEFGVQMRVEGGQITNESKAGTPVGTIVSMEHLFYNVPARQKFLRKAATEAGQISNIVQRYALAYPERRFSYSNDGRLIFQSTGSGDMFDVLVKIYGLENARQMVRVGMRETGSGRRETAHGDDTGDLHGDVDFMSGEETATHHTSRTTQYPIRVQGYASLPTLTRPNRSQIELFVNRRYVEARGITQAVIQAYHTLLPMGRYPVAVVLIEMDPSQLDVNVHPQKTEVRFADERAVFSAVQKAVRRAVQNHVLVPDFNLPNGTTGAPPTSPTDRLNDNAGRDNSTWADRRASIINAGQQPLDMYVPSRPSTQIEYRPPAAPNAANRDNQPGASQVASSSSLEPGSPSAPEAPQERPRHVLLGSRNPQLPPLRVVGQVGAMYIIAEGPEGVYLIDQHAAHERILYEKFMAQRYGTDGGEIGRQHLLQPLTLHLGSELTGLVAQHIDDLARVGFDIEPFGGDTFLVRAVPSVLSGQDPLRNLEEIVSSMADRRNLVGETLEARLVKMVCKRASIKAGQLLSDLEMQELVHQLEECQSPRTCPHGRPTMIQLSAGELEKAFGRV